MRKVIGNVHLGIRNKGWQKASAGECRDLGDEKGYIIVPTNSKTEGTTTHEVCTIAFVAPDLIAKMQVFDCAFQKELRFPPITDRGGV